MSEYHAELLHRVTQYHAFKLGDRAALYWETAKNPYTGHDADLAYQWELGFLGYPFPEREFSNA